MSDIIWMCNVIWSNISWQCHYTTITSKVIAATSNISISLKQYIRNFLSQLSRRLKYLHFYWDILFLSTKSGLGRYLIYWQSHRNVFMPMEWWMYNRNANLIFGCQIGGRVSDMGTYLLCVKGFILIVFFSSTIVFIYYTEQRYDKRNETQL